MDTNIYFGSGLTNYARSLRSGQFTIEMATRACLNRIAETNEELGSFVHVAEQSAIDTARAFDQLLRSGTDLGPLMGVPVGVKDLYAVTGMPTKLGSLVDLADTIPEEGSFLRKLRASGCVILGKTRTTELAVGGINLTHPTPWNPHSSREHLSPGGSSSGSAVAVSSNQCPWAIGGDTGGSIRQPAALCGVVGLKASQYRWDLDGIFSFSPTFDSIGYFNKSVRDAAQVYCGLQSTSVPAIRLDTLRLGKPSLDGFTELDLDVATAFDHAVAILVDAGVEIVPVELPAASDIDQISQIVTIELIGRLGRRRLRSSRHLIDPVPLARLEATMDAADYVELLHRRQRISRTTAMNMKREGLNGWVLPTVPHSATPMSELKTEAEAAKWNARTFRITRLANMLDQVAISVPAPTKSDALPVGFQISCPHGRELELLAMALRVEERFSTQLP